MFRLCKTDAQILTEVPPEQTEQAFQLVRILAQQAYRRCQRSVPLDELIGEAAVALVEAARRFDKDRQVPFGAYVTLVIRHHLMQVITTALRYQQQHVRSFGELSIHRKDGSVVPYDVPCLRTRRPEEEVIRRELLDRVQQVLPPRWFELLQLYYVEQRTLEEIGERLGVTKQRVGQLIAQARNRARRCLRDEEAA